MKLDGNTPPAVGMPTELTVGNEPWQVAIDGCDDTAYVVLRADQKLVEITNLRTTPTIGRTVDVGSEPTSLAILPHNHSVYVSNWVDGTIAVVDTSTFLVTETIDLNPAIVATGRLGTVASRAALAHPRGIAITNGNTADDTDGGEEVYATEWFATRTGPESATGTNSDRNWAGLLYQVKVNSGVVTTIDLPSVADTGFNDAKGQVTGCFPNQVATVTVDGGFAYVTSTCASPVGPVGVTQAGTCNTNADCAVGGICQAMGDGRKLCSNSCTPGNDATCSAIAATGDCVTLVPPGGVPANVCKPTLNNAKTTTHPALSVVDLSTLTATTTVIDKGFTPQAMPAVNASRVPLLPTDLAFKSGTNFAYVTAEGADATFKLTIANGAITTFGSGVGQELIDLKANGDNTIRLPTGIAVSANSAFAVVADDGNFDVQVINLNSQKVEGPTVHTTTPPTGNDLSILKGKRFFVTGTGRWSLAGAAWGSCAACHIDGLTDNVTWYFARGPRQTTSLDGTFATGDQSDQRALNWSAINDEVADFEGNTRGISGGIGALVTTANAPCTVATQVADCPNSQVCNAATLTCKADAKDRINTATINPPQQGLQGSSLCTAQTDAQCPTGLPHSAIQDWVDITNYVASIRSPKRPTNVDPNDAMAGQMLFGAGQGNCVGCHSGPKWTISTIKASTGFYKPDNSHNDAFGANGPSSLSSTNWNVMLNGFPPGLFPTATAANQRDRVGAPPGFEQLGCEMRPVGTIGPVAAGVPAGVSNTTDVNVLELRQDMKTGGQGSGGLANEPTAGFNVPSLLGMSVGAPYFHAGNARTLEEAFDSTLFLKHYQSAVASVFALDATKTKQLVAYILSIDEDETPVNIPAKGTTGGDICFPPP